MKISEILVNFAISTPQTKYTKKEAENYLEMLKIEDTNIEFTICKDLKEDIQEAKNQVLAIEWFNEGMTQAVNSFKGIEAKDFETLYSEYKAKCEEI